MPTSTCVLAGTGYSFPWLDRVRTTGTSSTPSAYQDTEESCWFVSEHRVTKIRTASKEVHGKQPVSCLDLARGSAVRPWSTPSSTGGCSGLHIWRSSHLFHSSWMDFRMGRLSPPAGDSGSLSNLFFEGTHSITLAPFCKSSFRIVPSLGPTELRHVPSVVYFLSLGSCTEMLRQRRRLPCPPSLLAEQLQNCLKLPETAWNGRFCVNDLSNECALESRSDDSMAWKEERIWLWLGQETRFILVPQRAWKYSILVPL